ncbi:MAG: DUF2238 domain-containing protein [Ignavibacteriales bacterium]|nr:DUF2238 domain-containing protein [Ignavibacteriales bacterium]
MKSGIEKFHLVLLAVFFSVLLWSFINPRDLFTWFLEVLPALIAVAILALTYNRFRLTNLAYLLICIHAVILMIGGHYTYAEMPLFNWLRDEFSLARNYYDRVGHFAQGFIPAIIAREVLVRTTPLRSGKMLFFIVVCICLAISAMYEFFEWWVALAVGENADAFLATQGDVWDTQWDMFLATCGAVISLLTLKSVHDKQLRSFLP